MKLLDELIMVIDVFSMIWVIWSDLGCLYVLRNNSLEGMTDKLKFKQYKLLELFDFVL